MNQTEPFSFSRRCLFAFFLCALCLQGPTDAQEKNDSTSDADFDTAVQLESFDQVWNTIKKVHWQPEKVGENWDQAKAEYRPKVESAKSIDQVRAAMVDILEEIGTD